MQAQTLRAMLMSAQQQQQQQAPQSNGGAKLSARTSNGDSAQAKTTTRPSKPTPPAVPAASVASQPAASATASAAQAAPTASNTLLAQQLSMAAWLAQRAALFWPLRKPVLCSCVAIGAPRCSATEHADAAQLDHEQWSPFAHAATHSRHGRGA